MHLRQPLPTARLDNLIEEVQAARAPGYVYRDGLKRVFDIVLVLITALPVLIVLGALCLVIMLDGKSPIYVQKRVGRNGRIFKMYKLRSMIANADDVLHAYLEANPRALAEWQRNQKLRHDPRITSIGHFIRKSSMDELPQLWNVLMGDMALVGPRPMMVCQQTLYPGTAYYAMRPGITGFWQTSVRNESSFADRAGFDTDYMRKLSFSTDVAVLLRTVRVVLHGTGC